MDIEHGVRIPVYGLGCGGGAARSIERRLVATEGVRQVYVNPATETAYIDYDPAQTDAWALVRAIESTGYLVGRPQETASSQAHAPVRRP